MGPQITALVFSALNLNLPQLLTSPKSVSQLAELTATIPEKLERLLLALEAFDIFSLNQETNEWSNSPFSSAFLNESFYAIGLWAFNPFHFEVLSTFHETLKQEKTPMELRFGTHLYDYLKEKPELLTIFQNAMKGATKFSLGGQYKGVDLSYSSKVLDVGGGDGTLLINLIQNNSHITGSVYELAEACDKARANIESNGLQDKITAIPGSFLESIPEGFDCIVMKHIIHDWSDENCKIILDNCRKSMQTGAQLKIIDHVLIRDTPNYKFTRYLDMHMMSVLGAKERTGETLETFLNASGFMLDGIVPLGQEYVVNATAI